MLRKRAFSCTNVPLYDNHSAVHGHSLCLVSDVANLKRNYSANLERNIHEDVYKSILFGKLNLNEGMFMENAVSQMLRTSGHKLYFYSRSDRENAEERMEIDFLIRRDRRISPIEVKSSNYRSHRSLDKFKSKFDKKIGECFILYTKDLMKDGKITYLPIYMGLCL
mgnify:CR=1 FL=1